MSLRIRLILLIVALVTGVVMILSGLYLASLVNSLSDTALDRAELASQQVNAYINDRINRFSAVEPAPTDLTQTETQWRDIVANDPDISNMLFRTMALSAALLEINVAGQDGSILASSNPSRIGQPLAHLENFTDWRGRSLYRRLMDLMIRKPDYQVVVPLGVGQSIFTIQVVTSSVFLIDPVLPQVSTVAEVAAGSLFLSLLLAGFATSQALRPLKRIEATIDRIAQGDYHGEEPRSAEHRSPEFVALESKLNLLGQKYSGARQDNTLLKQSLDDKIASMASQFDVASRLAAISRISGGVAHEIKNPLNAISLRLDLLRAHAEAQQDGLIPEIDILSNEVRRLDRVVKTFLDFSRPLEVRFADVDLGALAGEVANSMTPQARASGVEMHFEAPPEPAVMRGDADLLKQAILNLVTNALEAMKGGGKGGVLRLKVERTGDTAAVEISDNGPGIPPEVRDKVFQLYFTTKERGSGIGLAMTYRAVQLHNGTVDFTSELGRELPSASSSPLRSTMLKLRLLPIILALSLGSTSCWFRKSAPPRVFVPPPPAARPPAATVQPDLPPPPEIDMPEDAGIVEGIQAAMPPAEPPPPAPPRRTPQPVRATTQQPPPAPVPPEVQPTPRLGQIFTAEQLRDYNRALEESLDRVRRVLGRVAGRNLNPELTDIVSRIQTFQRQAEQAREQDLVTAVNLARRANISSRKTLSSACPNGRRVGGSGGQLEGRRGESSSARRPNR